MRKVIRLKKGPFQEEKRKEPKAIRLFTKKNYKYLQSSKYLDSLDKLFGKEKIRYGGRWTNCY